ncbi:MAG: T9SS type A sorting domain-containing protein [Bacteroidales bacterium]|nr:T9SS type A sorting domain-containing protein [Bacteroidales bacterium]MCF8387146.1 T9SS type A sorting domain-containing protein [Bacteroidales bacterium]MCF8397640.1 T9SS type A sorting domain-containing protein [Bacteroidales bacterium]
MNKNKRITSLLIAATIMLLNVHCVFGQEWEQVELPDNIGGVELYFDSTDIYLGTGDGIYVSHDNCESWEHLGLDNFMVRAIIMTSEDKLIVGATGRIFKYLGNQEWQLLYVLNEDIECAIEASNGNLFFGCWGSICRSIDGGETWNVVLAKYNTEAFYDIKESSSGVLFAGSTSFTGSNPGGFYRSEDDGESWELAGLEYHFVSSIVINSFDNIFVGTCGHYSTGSARVFKSLDNMGNSWEIVYDENYITSMCINDFNSIVISCPSFDRSPGGIFVTYDNGANWEDITPSFTGRYFEKVIFNNSNQIYAISYFEYGDVFRTINPITSISLSNNNSDISIYPNPAGDYILLETPHLNNYTLSILDMNGNELGRSVYNYSKINNMFDISDLKKGIYVVKVSTNKIILIEKFIKY